MLRGALDAFDDDAPEPERVTHLLRRAVSSRIHVAPRRPNSRHTPRWDPFRGAPTSARSPSSFTVEPNPDAGPRPFESSLRASTQPAGVRR